MMDSENIGEMLDRLEAAYGDAVFKNADRDKIFDLWEMVFANDDPEEVSWAVADCISTLQFPPKIADIKSRMSNFRLFRYGQMTEFEAFQCIKKAVNNAGGSKENNESAFNSLPPILQKVVGTPQQLQDWRYVDREYMETSVMNQVIKSYNTVLQREVYYNSLPVNMQNQLEEPLSLIAANIPVAPALPPVKRSKAEWETMRENGELPVLTEQQQEKLKKLKTPMSKEEMKAIERRLNPGAEKESSHNGGFSEVSMLMKKMLSEMVQKPSVPETK